MAIDLRGGSVVTWEHSIIMISSLLKYHYLNCVLVQSVTITFAVCALDSSRAAY